MKIIRILFPVVLLFSSAPLNAQNHFPFNEQFKFSDYLIKNKMWDDGKTFVHAYLLDSSFTIPQKDSAYFIAGKIYFRSENFDTAFFYYNKISNDFTSHDEAAMLASFSLAENHNYGESEKLFSSLTPSQKFGSEFLNFELFGAGLLNRDTSSLSSLAKTFSYADKNFSEEETELLKIKCDIDNIKRRSGFLAGCMSAVIPGLGKIYSGKTRQGLSSFLPVTLLGAQVFEAYKRSGVKSIRFILSAGLFSVFYIGNIWGSVLSVSVSRNEINDEINNQILLHMRIPLQRICGKD